jgi:hypothetical protein
MLKRKGPATAGPFRVRLLAETSKTAHVMQMFDSTVVRAHVSAAGAKGDRKSGARSLAWRVLIENP